MEKTRAPFMIILALVMGSITLTIGYMVSTQNPDKIVLISAAIFVFIISYWQFRIWTGNEIAELSISKSLTLWRWILQPFCCITRHIFFSRFLFTRNTITSLLRNRRFSGCHRERSCGSNELRGRLANPSNVLGAGYVE